MTPDPQTPDPQTPGPLTPVPLTPVPLTPVPLTPVQWREVEELFHRVLALPVEERTPFLAQACPGDERLRAEVASLVAALAGPAAFSELAAAELALELTGDEAAEPQPAPFPERLGPYRLLEVIGEGGMSTVYLAEQSEPLPRRVALKLMRWGGTHGRALRRFELEREALARMSHPNIAQVFGAGATEHGQPYVVIEYIPGLPITEYCDTQRLDLQQRLRLLVAVCDGVRHAHEKAVIHRDLKPSNILVAEVQGDPLPKIIDFGIAKSLEPWSDSAAQMTSPRLCIGSPGYISPEAFRDGGRGIDTRSDVYALGVVLCQLLIGVRPFATPPELAATVPGQAQRLDPPRPSQRLRALAPEERRQTAHLRRISEGQLLRHLHGELDWIVLRAVAHQPAARYGSAAALAADLERWLGGRPVKARPPSFPYRARKAMRRHALAFTATGLILATIVGFGIHANQLYRRAEAARQQAEALVGFMLDDLSARLEPMGRLDLLESVSRHSLTYFESSTDGRLDQAGHGPAAAMVQIGHVLASRGDLAAALSAYERARAIDQQRWQEDPADPAPRIDLARDLVLIGEVHFDQGALGLAAERYGEAEAHLRDLVRRFPDHQAAQLALAKTLGKATANLRRLQGETAAAEALFEEALMLLQALHRARPDDVEVSYALGDVYYASGLLTLFSLDDAEAALPVFAAGIATFQDLTESQPEAAIWRHRLAVLKGQGLVAAYSALRRPAAAREANRQALAIFEVLVREEPSNNRWAHSLGWELIRQGELALETADLETAVRAFERSTEVQAALVARATGPHAAWLEGLASAYQFLARVRSQRGVLAPALAAAEAALATLQRVVGGGDDANDAYHATNLATAGVLVGELRSQHGDIEGARQILAEMAAFIGRIDEGKIEVAFVREAFTETSQRLHALQASLGPPS